MDTDLHRQLTSGFNYRTHSAFFGGRVVAVKVFDGPRAKQVKKILILFGDLLIVTLVVLEAQSYIG